MPKNFTTLHPKIKDGIYASWKIFVKTIPDPINDEKTICQTSRCAKGVERAFGILQKRFASVAHPSRK